MRQYIQKLGKASAILLFMLIAVALTIVMDLFIAYVQQRELMVPTDLIRAAIISTVIAGFVFNYIYALYQNISTLENDLNDLATYDELTGLLNRPVFYKACEKSYNFSLRNKQSYCILAIELDSFKEINEKYGMAGGNRVLEVFGKVAQETVRDSDILARLGGDEFAVFLPNTNVEQAGTLANRLCEHIKHKAVIHDGTKYIKYTVSIGISVNQHNKTISLEKSLLWASDALKDAQQKGANHTEVYSRKSVQTDSE
jgi:diguanylate cyclase (GGDEF)-like protein